MEEPSKFKQRLSQVGWLVLIWFLSVSALTVVAVVFRFLMKMAGMTT